MKIYLTILIGFLLPIITIAQTTKAYPNYGVMEIADNKDYFVITNKSDFKVYKDEQLKKMSYSFSGVTKETEILRKDIDGKTITYIGNDFCYYINKNQNFDVVIFEEKKQFIPIFLIKVKFFTSEERKKLTLNVMNAFHNMKLTKY
ncbi:hypothetical protein [Parasediminibacterium sp. JCM 36343]|uniref:hypothetical protein n=1 Tax=Parasediminibacterium sp. JCM 36343 TaxID=3374279 RepID=UPI003978E81F